MAVKKQDRVIGRIYKVDCPLLREHGNLFKYKRPFFMAGVGVFAKAELDNDRHENVYYWYDMVLVDDMGLDGTEIISY